MIRKTYGVSGLMDWTTQIKAGKAAVSVHFTGGALTAYGVTPAKYSTSNPIFQNVIENSDQFKSGRIELLSQMEVPDDAATIARKARAEQMKKAQAVPVAQNPAGETTGTAAEETTTEQKPEEAEPAKPTDEVATETQLEDDVEGDDADGTIKVSDKNEAVEYLKEHFADKGYTATSLRTKTAFEAACKECGVEFVFTA